MWVIEARTMQERVPGLDVRALLASGLVPYVEFGERITPSTVSASEVFSGVLASRVPDRLSDADWAIDPGACKLDHYAGSGFDGLVAAEDTIERDDAVPDIAMGWISDRRTWASCRLGDYLLMHYAHPAVLVEAGVDPQSLSTDLTATLERSDGYSGDRFVQSGLAEAICALWASAE